MGPGSTGVQIATEVAKSAQQLKVFQRHPNWCAPLCNGPIDAERMVGIKQRYAEILQVCESTTGGFQCDFLAPSAVEAPAAEREALFEKLYREPGFGIWVGHYQDVFTNKEANALISDFVARKIRQRVKDPLVADKLIPKDHGFGLKRVPMESRYYEIYNQQNVELVDIHAAPIEEVTPFGIRTAAQHYDLDVIIYATGFDSIIGALKQLDIRGRGGKTLREAWSDGPYTYLGVQIPDFPNFFTLVGAHNGATNCNVPRCAEAQVNWVSDLFSHISENKIDCVEASGAAADEWTQHVNDMIDKTLFPSVTNSWFWGKFGKQGKIRYQLYPGGNPAYKTKVNEVAANGYEGFVMRQAANSG